MTFARSDNKNASRADQRIPVPMTMNCAPGFNDDKFIKIGVFMLIRIMFSVVTEKIYSDLQTAVTAIVSQKVGDIHRQLPVNTIL